MDVAASGVCFPVPSDAPSNIPGASAPARGAAAGPLSDEHVRELSAARARSAKVRRAAGIATFNGWTLAVFAAVTVVGGVLGDWAALVLGAALGASAYAELRGAGMIRRFDAAGARVLGVNQLALGGVVLLYAGWSMYSAAQGAAAMQSVGDAQVDAMVQQISGLVIYGLYGSIAAFALIVPPLTAWYYFSRGPIVRAMVEQTPAWALEALRIAG